MQKYSANNTASSSHWFISRIDSSQRLLPLQKSPKTLAQKFTMTAAPSKKAKSAGVAEMRGRIFLFGK